MRIRRLKLSGFKSFVEPAELRIEPGLTGVVGPNGCGKSNLLEAIRWVMGESSPKSMRGSGMDDVIFAGTATRPPRDFAEVSILLERGAGEEGAGEGVLERRAHDGARRLRHRRDCWTAAPAGGGQDDDCEGEAMVAHGATGTGVCENCFRRSVSSSEIWFSRRRSIL